MTSCRSRGFVLERVFVLEVMADLQPYRFEPERVPNPEDSESENEEVNDRLEGTFWCTCERCEIIPTQRECVCCREQPEAENKMEGRTLDIKRRFNKAVSSYFSPQLSVFSFHFLAVTRRDFLYHCKRSLECVA